MTNRKFHRWINLIGIAFFLTVAAIVTGSHPSNEFRIWLRISLQRYVRH